MGESHLRRNLGMGSPLTHRERVKPQSEIAPRQRFTGLSEGVHTRAASDQHLLAWCAAIRHAFEPALPSLHFVDFIKHEQWRALSPALCLNHGAVGRHIKVQILRTGLQRHKLLTQGGLSDLTRAGKDNHFF